MLNIKHPEADRLARALAQQTGETITDVVIEALREKHQEHIAVYGHDLELRLTGKHETSDMKTFSAGIANRGSSIRIPRHVANEGYGYFEDRRPGANANPYEVAAALVKTVCGV